MHIARGERPEITVQQQQAFNPSRDVVLLEDDGCYSGDRGGSAAASELRKVRRARGMKDSMPSLN